MAEKPDGLVCGDYVFVLINDSENRLDFFIKCVAFARKKFVAYKEQNFVALAEHLPDFRPLSVHLYLLRPDELIHK